MCLSVCRKEGTVTLVIDIAIQHFDISGSDRLLVGNLDIVLRTDVNEAKGNRRQAGNGVVPVGDAEVAARLSRNVIAELRTGNAGCAECVERDLQAVVAKICGSESSNSAAERMADDGNLVGGICSLCLLDRGYDALASLQPRCPKASMHSASGTEICGNGIEREVRDPVTDRLGAAESNND